jgi:NAD(P)-dependent dehydrogenase (short-subunit alcohol dehydrogenase family)
VDISGATKAGRTAEELFESIIQVNLTGAFFTVGSALLLLKTVRRLSSAAP